MGLFSYNWQGSDRELPPSKGVARLWELLTRDFGKFFRAGFLALLGCVPFLLGIMFAVLSHGLLAAPLVGLIGGTIAGPELCGMADTVLRSLRDEPGFWWYTYQKSWKRNAKSSLLPGGIGGMLLSTQLFLVFHAGALGFDIVVGIMLVLGILLVLGLSLYVWPMIALMELPLSQVLRNAVLLFLGHLPRSMGALCIIAVCFGLPLWSAAFALPLPITNFWLPVVPAMFLIYPVIEDSFQIEEKLQASR